MSVDKFRATIVSVGLFLLAMANAAMAAPVVVYDNTTTFTKGLNDDVDGYKFAPNGIWPFNSFAPDEPMGDQITLAGAQRTLTEFDLVLSSTKPVTLPNLTLSLYDIDYDVETNAPAPGNLLWETTESNVVVAGPTIVPILAPEAGIRLPNGLIWLAGADSEDAGLATCNPPSVGDSNDWYWDVARGYPPFSLDFWGDPVANFGARVWAVPEPTAAAALVAGWFLSMSRRSRRGRRS
jgi:hypothetical protein